MGPEALFVSLLKHVLTGLVYPQHERSVMPSFRRELQIQDLNLELRQQGLDWPLLGLTMIGLKRLENIEQALDDINLKGVPGDFVECGVWRGGASIFASAISKLQKSPSVQRKVWLLDSFQGFPKTQFREDFEVGIDNQWATIEYVRVDEALVKQNFVNLNLADWNRIGLIKGYFEDSVPKFRNQIEKIAVLRFDGDMYSSTMAILYNLYAKLSIGGWLIIDDWNIGACREAINQFRNEHGITEQIIKIDNSSIFWIKEADVTVNLRSWESISIDHSNYGYSVAVIQAFVNVLIALSFLHFTVKAAREDLANQSNFQDFHS